MPKNALNLENFSGGLDNNTNKRDVENNTLVVLDGLDIETPGKIRLMGSVEDYALVTSTNDEVVNSTVYYGNGLLHLNLDRRIDSAVNQVNTQYLFINDPATQKVRMLDVNNNTLIAAGNAATIDYGDTAAQVEYLVIDGEVRVSPWLVASVPFPTGNQIKKLKYINTVKNLGVPAAGDTANIPNITISNLYKADNAYIAPIKARTSIDASADRNYGAPDGYGYDTEAVMDGSWFKADYDSEATCNTTFDESNIDNTYTYMVSRTAAQVGAVLDGHSEWAQNYGGIELAIWTGNTVNADSEIYNYYHTAGGVNPNGYEIYASNVYDSQESVPVNIGSVINHTIVNQTEDKAVPLYYCMVGRMPNKPFQTGINFYWARRRDGEAGQKYLLFEVNFEKGYRKGGDKTYNNFYESNTTGPVMFVSNQFALRGAINSISGLNRELLSLSEDEPHIGKDVNVIGRAGTGYKTATVVNRRSYIGNIAYYDIKSDSTSYIKQANDTVIKSLVNEFDYFPIENRIDVEINDGEDIIKLASIADKLLEFKQNTLYIINCSRNIEYLEGNYRYKGVAQPYHVVEGEGFVAWINQYGAYLYDGEQITNILYNKVGQKKLVNWNASYYSDDNVIGYLPHKQTIFIGNKNGKILMYDLKSSGWMYSSNKFMTNDITNMVTVNDGNLVWYEKDNTTLKIHRWNDAPAALTLSNNTVILQTKDFTFDSPDLNKKIHTAYINYILPNSTHVKINALADNGTTATLTMTDEITNPSVPANVALLPIDGSPGRTQDIKLSLTSSSAYKNVKSFALQVVADGSAIDAGFEINDMQIIYRGKNRK